MINRSYNFYTSKGNLRIGPALEHFSRDKQSQMSLDGLSGGDCNTAKMGPDAKQIKWPNNSFCTHTYKD